MGCGAMFVKYILFFVNLVFALAGLALIGVGIAVQLQVTQIVDAVEKYFEVAPITAIVIGSIVFLIAFFGCCGAVKESNCMLITYAVFMLVLMIAKITLAVLIFINIDSFLGEVQGWLTDSFNRDQVNFQEIEKAFQCCGPNGAMSYNIQRLPDTCCATPACTLQNAYDGCSAAVEKFFNTFGITIGSLAIAVSAVELVAIVFGLCLANHVRNASRRARY